MSSDREIPFKTPVRAEVYKKKLTGIEQAVLLAMLEIGDSSGEILNISIARIAAYTKFDKRSVQRALWGDHRTHPGIAKPKRLKGKAEPECPHCKGLVQRRILYQEAPADWKERRPARYRLILDLLDNSEEVSCYLDQNKFNFPALGKNQPVHPSVPRSLGPQRPTVTTPASHGRTPQRPTVA